MDSYCMPVELRALSLKMLWAIALPFEVALLVMMLPGLNEWLLFCLWWVCSGEVRCKSCWVGSSVESIYF